MSDPIWHPFASDASILIQGMTGKEGQRMTWWLRTSGMRVCAGVTPGKGGALVEGCPVFNTVAEACRLYPEICATSIVVPAAHVREAVEEALVNGIKYIHLLSESVPVHDVLWMRQQAIAQQATILGPSSIGYLQFPAFRLGFIGGEDPFAHLRPGSIGLVSTSGGMMHELMMAFSCHHLGIRVAFAVGGDRFSGMSIEEALKVCDTSPHVERLVVFTEPGRPFLDTLLSDRIAFSHPLVVFLAGDILDDLPRDHAYGHTGTLLSENNLSVQETRKRLKEKGFVCVQTTEEVIEEVKKIVR